MPRQTPAERYAARKARVAQGLRDRTIEAANRGRRHAHLRAHLGDHWRDALAYTLNNLSREWAEIAERNPPTWPVGPRLYPTAANPYARFEVVETGYWDPVRRRPFLRPRNPGADLCD